MNRIKNQFIRLGGFHGIIVMSIYRTGNLIYYHVKIPILRQLLLILYHLIDYIVLRTILFCEIPARCKIGKNLVLPHGGKGIIIDQNTIIGNNVTIYHQVTIGVQGTWASGSPVIGDDVLIGAGAKVLGKIHVGNKAKIGANAVVVHDLPVDSTAVPHPTRIITRQMRLIRRGFLKPDSLEAANEK